MRYHSELRICWQKVYAEQESIFVSDVAHGRLSICSMDSPTPMHIKTELRELSGLKRSRRRGRCK